MAEFQTVVNTKQADSVAGDIVSNVPTTGTSMIVTSETDLNVYGCVAFCYDKKDGIPTDDKCRAGGDGAFIGIACLPKSDIGGKIGDPYNYFARRGSVISLVTSGVIHVAHFMMVQPKVGDKVYFNIYDGMIFMTPNTIVSPAWRLIKGAKVVYDNGQYMNQAIHNYEYYTASIRLTGEGKS